MAVAAPLEEALGWIDQAEPNRRRFPIFGRDQKVVTTKRMEGLQVGDEHAQIKDRLLPRNDLRIKGR